MSKKLILNWLVNKGSRERELSREGQYFSYFFSSSFLYSERNSLLSVEKYYFCHRARIVNHMFKLPRSPLTSFRPLHAPTPPRSWPTLAAEWVVSFFKGWFSEMWSGAWLLLHLPGGGRSYYLYVRPPKKREPSSDVPLSPSPTQHHHREIWTRGYLVCVCRWGRFFFVHASSQLDAFYDLYISAQTWGS